MHWFHNKTFTDKTFNNKCFKTNSSQTLILTPNLALTLNLTLNICREPFVSERLVGECFVEIVLSWYPMYHATVDSGDDTSSCNLLIVIYNISMPYVETLLYKRRFEL